MNFNPPPPPPHESTPSPCFIDLFDLSTIVSEQLTRFNNILLIFALNFVLSHTTARFNATDRLPVSPVTYLVVVVLDLSEVWFDERQLVELGEESDGAGVVHAGDQHRQQVVEHHGLVVQVELDRLVIQLNVGNLQSN